MNASSVVPAGSCATNQYATASAAVKSAVRPRSVGRRPVRHAFLAALRARARERERACGGTRALPRHRTPLLVAGFRDRARPARSGALEDQINAGAVMWLAAGTPTFLALLWCVADWGARERRLGALLDASEEPR